MSIDRQKLVHVLEYLDELYGAVEAMESLVQGYSKQDEDRVRLGQFTMLYYALVTLLCAAGTALSELEVAMGRGDAMHDAPIDRAAFIAEGEIEAKSKPKKLAKKKQRECKPMGKNIISFPVREGGAQ